jgi:hypothetical protein
VVGGRELGRCSSISDGCLGESGNCKMIGSSPWVSFWVSKDESVGCGAVCGLRRDHRGGRDGVSDVIHIG